MNPFIGRRIVVTGAASGLGRALALRFARDGWRVAIADVELGRSEETLREVKGAGGDGFVERCDVRKESDWEALRERVKKEWGGLDVLVNNAGVGSSGSVTETPLADWEWTLDINLLGVIRGCRTFVPVLVEQGRGHVVNVASFAAIASAPGMAAYNVAKAGVFSLSESLRAEIFDDGVGVSVACPSFFQTNLLESFRSPDPGVKARVARLMQRAKITAADVADDIHRAALAGEFLVISHEDAKWQHRLKRVAPRSSTARCARRPSDGTRG
jgi:NAD(P)-dependent dehydrogenase (short-subunit alcohol dehydrogenase family)